MLRYYRMEPDNKRMIFGGRARFTPVTPAISAPLQDLSFQRDPRPEQ
jgi:hypothetical protein